MRIIVTGGSGFIGSAVCRRFVAILGATVLNIDKLTYAANLASLDSIVGHQRYHFRKADICDRAAMEAAFDAFRPDAVIHLAAESHVDRSIMASGAFMETNFMGTYTLLEVALTYWTSLQSKERDGFRFLHVSTDEVYGSLAANERFRENTPYNPSSPYSASKAASDHIVTAWHRTYGLPALVSTCCNNYGPYQFPEKLIPLSIMNARDRRALPVYGDGMNVRDWLYVDDHVHALHLILERGRPGEKYNVGGRSEMTNIDVVERICALMDERQPRNAPHRNLITYVADRPGHDRRYAIDATKLVTEVGWRAQEDFSSGLEKTVNWYLNNTAWCEPLRKGTYRGERLGLSLGDGAKGPGASS